MLGKLFTSINIPAPARGYIYAIVTAALGLAVVYGLVDQSKTAAWISLIAQVLGIGGLGTAVAHMPAFTPDPPPNGGEGDSEVLELDPNYFS